MKQGVVDWPELETQGTFPPVINKGSTANSQIAKGCFKASPIHNDVINDEERSAIFVHNLASPATSLNQQEKGKLSMQNAAAYWGLEYVNIKFGAKDDNPIQPGDYKPEGMKLFNNVPAQDPDMLPVGGIPNIKSPISIEPPLARGPGPQDPIVKLGVELYAKAATENKAGPGAANMKSSVDMMGAVERSSAGSILQVGMTLGHYLPGKSSYTDSAAAGSGFTAAGAATADWDKESGAV